MTANKINYDSSALRARILDKYNTLKDFAQAIGMAPETLSSRLNGHTDFYATEISRICSALDVHTDEEIKLLFFTSEHDRLMDLYKAVSRLTDDYTDEEIRQLIKVMSMTTGNPARREYAFKWNGSIYDLPAALTQI